MHMHAYPAYPAYLAYSAYPAYPPVTMFAPEIPCELLPPIEVPSILIVLETHDAPQSVEAYTFSFELSHSPHTFIETYTHTHTRTPQPHD